MSSRILFFMAAFCLSWDTMETILNGRRPFPKDATAFKNMLKSFRRPPGPLGYFNSVYMAFNRKQTEHFLNLASCHSKMRKIKNGELPSFFSIWNDTQINRSSEDGTRFQNAPPTKRNKEGGKNYKRNPSYPITTITGECETTIGGVNRLCKVCPAVTDLGPDKIPRYINELLCEGYEVCGVEEVFAICQNTALNQDFLMFQNLMLQVYSQPIRVCCECSLIP